MEQRLPKEQYREAKEELKEIELVRMGHFWMLPKPYLRVRISDSHIFLRDDRVNRQRFPRPNGRRRSILFAWVRWLFF